jgi:hypothetical protein
MRSRALLLAACASARAAALGVAPQPWAPLNGGGFTGAPAPQSPDPLARYRWPFPGTDDTQLQIYESPAVAAGPAPGTRGDAFLNTSSAAGSIACAIRVVGNGSLVVDFGVERAGWFEFDSADLLPADAGGIVMGLSEYETVDWLNGFKQGGARVYGANCGAGGAANVCTYRLETNPVGPELYEGIRYGFLTLRSAPSAPFTISALRVVGQAKPMNYVGAFASAGDPLLERVWYTAAYTVRATAQADYMGSILMARGDRFSWFVALRARARARLPEPRSSHAAFAPSPPQDRRRAPVAGDEHGGLRQLCLCLQQPEQKQGRLPGHRHVLPLLRALALGLL